MNTYTLVIKGDVADGFEACRLHRLEITSIVKHEVWNEAIVTCIVQGGDTKVLTNWLCEADEGTPYPVGTLLWYAPHIVPVPDTLEYLVQGRDNVQIHADVDKWVAAFEDKPTTYKDVIWWFEQRGDR